MQPSQNDQLPDINTIPGPEPLNNALVFKDTPEKKSHAMLYGMILLAILAAGGIGFGVWSMLDGNQKVENLNAKINELNSQLAEKNLATSEEVVTIDETGEIVATSDYIYVGEWGIKIKKPNNWRDSISGYSFSNDYPQAVDTFTIKQISDSDLANIMISYVESCEDKVVEANAVCLDIDGGEYMVMPGAAATPDFSEFFTNIENYSAL